MAVYRISTAYDTRVQAAQLAREREHPPHLANGDEQRWASSNYAMSFTKGLPHRQSTGMIADRRDFEAFRRAIDDGFIDAFSTSVPVAIGGPTMQPFERRQWEAPTAGVTYDLQGPDAQAVTMPPAPALGSAELAYEMAEVYELALLHDVPFTAFEDGAGNPDVGTSVGRLNALDYDPTDGTGRPRKVNAAGDVSDQTAFRGASPGVEVGPYLSQFMLIGNDDLRGTSGTDTVASGLIAYGAHTVDQRVAVAAQTDWMTTRNDWLAVQRGRNVRDNNTLFTSDPRRFITTPRDLATYVHDDALYQAYLNACLILLGMRTPFDAGFAHLAGGRDLFAVQPNNTHTTMELQATGFALFGGPHILSLVTEVATRALKAVRYQKYNVHLRLRPEALAGRIEYANEPDVIAECPDAAAAFQELAASIAPTVAAVQAANASGSALLPMAFQEGSPMHPAYGAGHATVAGACVTILKAFFDTDAVFVRRGGRDAFLGKEAGDSPVAYRPNAAPGALGSSLVPSTDGPFLKLEGELNKLAANISIGRNMGGVHYFTDYYDSLRMGEAIAIGMLEEQALCYPTDQFVLSVPTFDGKVARIGAR